MFSYNACQYAESKWRCHDQYPYTVEPIPHLLCVTCDLLIYRLRRLVSTSVLKINEAYYFLQLRISYWKKLCFLSTPVDHVSYIWRSMLYCIIQGLCLIQVWNLEVCCLCISSLLLYEGKCLANSYIVFWGKTTYTEAVSKREGLHVLQLQSQWKAWIHYFILPNRQLIQTF